MFFVASIVDIVSLVFGYWLLFLLLLWVLFAVPLVVVVQMVKCLTIYPLGETEGFREYTKEVYLGILSTVFSVLYVTGIKAFFLFTWLSTDPSITGESWLFANFEYSSPHDALYSRTFHNSYISSIIVLLICGCYLSRSIVAWWVYRTKKIKTRNL